MEVRSGAEWTNPTTSSKRILDITLSDLDGIVYWHEEWAEMPVMERLKRLQKLADSYIVVAMMNEGAFSKEYAVSRLKAIKEA